jgi:serine/threonine protein kinase
MERWQKIEELFQLTIDCAESDRAALLAGACAGDESLREEVESLLTFHARSDGLIDSSAVEDGLKVFLDGSKDALAGSRLGPYKVIREISRGGMGAVYLAARANDYEKRVAIKLIKRGMDTDEILSRFRNERQILASLR